MEIKAKHGNIDENHTCTVQLFGGTRPHVKLFIRHNENSEPAVYTNYYETMTEAQANYSELASSVTGGTESSNKDAVCKSCGAPEPIKPWGMCENCCDLAAEKAASDQN